MKNGITALFSERSKEYALYRPGYPSELFRFLSGLVEHPKRVWDVGCGSGQASLGFVPFFEEILASDASPQQLQYAKTHTKIKYFQARAENSGITTDSVDLIACAQSVHWFNLKEFYKEAKRVLKPKGILALWCYRSEDLKLLALPKKTKKILQILLQNFFQILENYWPPERKYVSDGYQSLFFKKSQEITAPSFCFDTEWTTDQLLGYFNTWSSLKQFEKINSSMTNPLETLRQELQGNRQLIINKLHIQWKICLRVTRL